MTKLTKKEKKELKEDGRNVGRFWYEVAKSFGIWIIAIVSAYVYFKYFH